MVPPTQIGWEKNGKHCKIQLYGSEGGKVNQMENAVCNQYIISVYNLNLKLMDENVMTRQHFLRGALAAQNKVTFSF